MFDIAWSELGLIGLVAVVVLGPKELPQAMRLLGRMTRQARKLINEVQGHVNNLVNEAELAELRQSVEKVSPTNIRAQIEKEIDLSGELGAARTASNLGQRDVKVTVAPKLPEPENPTQAQSPQG